MKNQNFLAFLITGIALSMSIICWFAGLRQFAILFAVLAVIQVAIVVYQHRKKRK